MNTIPNCGKVNREVNRNESLFFSFLIKLIYRRIRFVDQRNDQNFFDAVARCSRLNNGGPSSLLRDIRQPLVASFFFSESAHRCENPLLRIAFGRSKRDCTGRAARAPFILRRCVQIGQRIRIASIGCVLRAPERWIIIVSCHTQPRFAFYAPVYTSILEIEIGREKRLRISLFDEKFLLFVDSKSSNQIAKN